MTPGEVETVYEALATTLDSVEASRRELFLANLALLLAHDIADTGRVRRRIDEAARNLDV